MWNKNAAGWLLVLLIMASADIMGAEQPLSMANCIDQALAHNPSFQAIRRMVEKAEARTREVAADRYPNLFLSGSARRFSSMGPVGEDYSGGLSLRYELYEGGRTRARIEGAEHGVRAVESQRETGRQDLIFRVTEAFYRAMEQVRLVAVAQQRLDRTEVHLSAARARLAAGLTTRLDTLRAAVEQSVAQLALVRARNSLENALGALNVLLGREAHMLLSLAADLDFEAVAPVDGFDAYLTQAMNLRPEIQRAEATVDQQRAEVRVARADYMPRISLDASYAWNGPGIGSLDRDWRTSATLSLPLFTGFSTRFRVVQATVGLTQLQMEHKALRQEVGRQVWEAYLAMREGRDRIDQTAVLVAQTQERMAVAEGEYRAGVGSMVEVVDAQTALSEAEEARISAFADYRVALARLDRVSGMPVR